MANLPSISADISEKCGDYRAMKSAKNDRRSRRPQTDRNLWGNRKPHPRPANLWTQPATQTRLPVASIGLEDAWLSTESRRAKTLSKGPARQSHMDDVGVGADRSAASSVATGAAWGLALAGRKPRREELPPDGNLCQYCSAKCCQYLAIQIDEPTTARQFDYLVWFLLHERVAVFMERKKWFVLFRTPCKELLKDGRCGIYERRPKICRRYSTKRCEYEDDWVYEKIFELPEQVLEYAEVMLAPPGVVKRTHNKFPSP